MTPPFLPGWPCSLLLGDESVVFALQKTQTAGERVCVGQASPSICDSLLVGSPGKINFEIMRELTAPGLVVTDDEVREVYLDAGKVKAPKTTAVDSEAAHETKNRALVKESNKAL